MKRLLYLIPLFFIQQAHTACQDSITSGYVGFVTVTTGCVDSSRRYDDKQNGNWRMASSSMATLDSRLNSVAVDTNSINTAFRNYSSTADAQQTKFVNFSTTGDALQGIFASTSSLHAGNTNYIGIANSLQAGATFFVSSGTVDSALRIRRSLTIGDLDSDVALVTISTGSKIHLRLIDVGRLDLRPYGTAHEFNELAAGSNEDLIFNVTGTGRFGFNTNNPGPTIGIDGGLGVGSSFSDVDPGGNNLIVEGSVGIGVATATSKVDIVGGSVTIRGGNAGLAVRGGSITIDGTFISTTGFTINGGTITTLSFPSGKIQTEAGIGLDGSSQTKSGGLTLGGDLTFKTTYYLPSGFPFAVGNATNAVTNSTNALNGLAFLDSQSSTPGLNTCFYKIVVPENFVAGSTPILTSLAAAVTGFVDLQESWVLSFATEASHALSISTGSGAPSLNYSSAVVVAVTGQTSLNGGVRTNKANIKLNGVGVMLGVGDTALYIRAVRDATSVDDTATTRSAITHFTIAGKFQQ